MAGINGTPVQRLAQTRDLVPPPVQKELMRLVILMGTQKGHFAYRLAWDNTFGERIPFLPLHRRDLVSTEEGNKTFVGENGDRINWRKFEIMGDVVLGIQRSQRTPYPHMPKNEEVLRLVLDTRPMHGEEVSNTVLSFLMFPYFALLSPSPCALPGAHITV
jgi:RasGEF domain